jgi:hypothetical protein
MTEEEMSIKMEQVRIERYGPCPSYKDHAKGDFTGGIFLGAFITVFIFTILGVISHSIGH